MGGKDYRNMLILKFESQAQMPDMRYLVDIPNTSDPLTILLGAPSLKNQHDLQWKLRYELTPQNGRIMEAAQIYYRLLTNALVRATATTPARECAPYAPTTPQATGKPER